MAISNPWTIAFYDEFLYHSDKLSFECEYGQMYFSDIQYYGGKMYISAYTTPAMMDGNLLLRYDYLNEYAIRLKPFVSRKVKVPSEVIADDKSV